VKFTLVTDHKGLEYFDTQKNLSDRQVQWWEFLSRFNFTIMHVDGIDNKVADCLSRYYENDTGDESHPEHIYMNADARLDPDSELLPTDRYMELNRSDERVQPSCQDKRSSDYRIRGDEQQCTASTARRHAAVKRRRRYRSHCR
jgi:RNase H-like domain found in reverse transcriptase